MAELQNTGTVLARQYAEAVKRDAEWSGREVRIINRQDGYVPSDGEQAVREWAMNAYQADRDSEQMQRFIELVGEQEARAVYVDAWLLGYLRTDED